MANVVQGQKKSLFHPLFDSFRYLTTGHASISFFREALGSGVSPHMGGTYQKSELDTNLRGVGGLLPPGQTMRVHGIRVKFKQTAFTPLTQAEDLWKMLQTGTLIIKLGESVQVEQQLCDFNSGQGMSGFFGTTAAATTVGSVTNGLPVTENYWKLYDKPFSLHDETSGQPLPIDAKIVYPVAATITTATVVVLQLEGYREGSITA